MTKKVANSNAMLYWLKKKIKLEIYLMSHPIIKYKYSSKNIKKKKKKKKIYIYIYIKVKFVIVKNNMKH